MRRSAFVIALSLVLTGCGGRAAHLLPAGGLGTDGASRSVRSSNVTAFNGTLWYGDDRSLYGVPLTNGAATTQINGSYAGLVGPSSRAMTVAIDGTVYELIQDNASAVRWQLRIYAPGTHGSASPEETLSGSGYPQQVMLVADGIDVLSSTGPPRARGSSTLSTFAYGSASFARPVRTLALGRNVADVATDRDNRIYVARSGGAGIAVYPAGASCNCSPVRTIATGPNDPTSLAVASDGTVYVLAVDTARQIATVNAYAGANNGPTPSRAIGPFYENSDVAPPGFPVSSPTGGITVDGAGDLFVGFSDGAGNVRVEMYASNSDGGGAPARTIATPAFSTYITSITIGPATVGTAIAPTLYVGSRSTVFAFAADASGTAPPSRTIPGFYLNVGPSPYLQTQHRSLTAIATTPDGTLAALQSTRVGVQHPALGCLLTFWSPNGGFLSSPYCDGYLTGGMARGVDGELDLVMDSYAFPNPQEVRRVVNGVFSGSFTFGTPAQRSAIAVDRAGNIFVTTSDNTVEQYPRNTSGSVAPARSFALNGTLGPMCAAPDGTLYVGAELVAAPSAQPLDYVYAIAPGTSTPARTLGPFTNAVNALACDSQGRLYVGMTLRTGTGTRVKVFSPKANGLANPLWVLTDPVPANDPGGVTIVSLALSP